MKRLFYLLDHFCGNRWFPVFFIPIAFCFLLLYSNSTSPLYLSEGCDSVIFKTMGLALLQGKIPYVDIFDHKGPVLYFINALGQWLIPGRLGIFMLQIVSLSIALLFMYKICKLLLNNVLSFVWVIVALCILGVFFEGGNLTEEWNLPYFVIPLYYAMTYFCNEKERLHPIKYSLIYGLCFGIAFYIRPNDAVAQVGGIMAGVTIWIFYQKEYTNLFRNILFFFIGFMVISVPIVVWYGLKGALGDLYYGLLKFNALYSESLFSMMISVIGMNKIKFFIFFVALLVMIYNTSYRQLSVLFLPILTFVVVFTGTRPYSHYYMVVIPYFMLFFVFLCIQKNKSIIVCSIAVILASHTDTLKMARKTPKTRIKYAINVMKNGVEESKLYKETDELLQYVPENEKCKIWNYNLNFSIAMLWHQGLVQANKVPLFSMYQVDKKLKEEDDIIKKRPEFILFSENHSKDATDYAFILSNYDMIAQTDSTICKIALFKRK